MLNRVENNKKIKGTKISIKEKVVFFWSEDYAKRRQHKREEEKAKIQYFIKNQDVLPKLDKGLKSYIKEDVVDSNGKKIKDAKVIYVFDEEKFNEDMKYDGYYAIITSEINLTDDEIIEKYRGLSEIENSFRILQSDLEGQPIYVRKKSRIEGHFLTCFIALTIMRILQNLTKREVPNKKDKNKMVTKMYSVESLVEAINSANLHTLTNAYLSFSKTDEIYKDIENMFGLNNDFRTLELEKFNQYKKELLYAIKNASFR